MTIEDVRTRSSDRLMMISIHTRHVEAIVSGAKTVELRRLRPSIAAGQPVAIYATAPAAAVVATCRIHTVEVGTPHEMWQRHHHSTGITLAEFNRYFTDARHAVALLLDQVQPLEEPVTLEDLRRSGPFHPPQTWHFLDQARIECLLDGHPSELDLTDLLPRRADHRLSQHAAE